MLEGADVDQVSAFRLPDAEDKPLVRFIRRDALKSSAANLTRTYVVKSRDGDKKVQAYVSLMCAEIGLEQTYSITDKIGADRYNNQPAVRIARLAVDASLQRKGFGKILVRFAVGVARRFVQPNVGCRFVVLDAKPKSVSFYEGLGFRLLDTETNRASETPTMFLDLQDLN